MSNGSEKYREELQGILVGNCKRAVIAHFVILAVNLMAIWQAAITDVFTYSFVSTIVTGSVFRFWFAKPETKSIPLIHTGVILQSLGWSFLIADVTLKVGLNSPLTWLLFLSGAGIISGSVASLSCQIKLFYKFTIILTLFPFLVLLHQADTIVHYSLAVLFLTNLVFISVQAREYHRSLIENFELRDKAEQRRIHSLQSAKLASVGVLAAGVAHEINNPLAIVLGYSKNLNDLLKDSKLALPDATKAIENIQIQCERITKIVSGMMIFAKESDRKVIGKIDPVNFKETCLNFCRSRFETFGVELDFKMAATNKDFEGNFVDLSQVVVGLLNNALDSVRNTEGAKNVSLQIEYDNDAILIKVFDSGPQIEEGLENRIFEPFFSTKSVGSVGLGLSVAKGIVDSHSGTLSYHRSPKCFVMKLPLNQSNSTSLSTENRSA